MSPCTTEEAEGYDRNRLEEEDRGLLWGEESAKKCRLWEITISREETNRRQFELKWNWNWVEELKKLENWSSWLKKLPD